MRLVNLTPHPVTLFHGDHRRVLPVGGPFARVTRTVVGEADHEVHGLGAVRLVDVVAGADVAELPPPTPGVGYVVAQLTALASPDRDDLYFPWDEVRDGSGKLLGVRGLARFRPAAQPAGEGPAAHGT
jgi:hypothetical protein